MIARERSLRIVELIAWPHSPWTLIAAIDRCQKEPLHSRSALSNFGWHNSVSALRHPRCSNFLSYYTPTRLYCLVFSFFFQIFSRRWEMWHRWEMSSFRCRELCTARRDGFIERESERGLWDNKTHKGRMERSRRWDRPVLTRLFPGSYF